jgi:hypothetical protein
LTKTPAIAGISRKLLKKKIKERGYHRKIDGLIEDLEEDERSGYDMLSEKLGELPTRRWARRRWHEMQVYAGRASAEIRWGNCIKELGLRAAPVTTKPVEHPHHAS